MFVLVVCMGQSPYNRSIWTGLSRGFERQGCKVEVVDAQQLPKPMSWSALPDLLMVVHGGNTSVEVIQQYTKAGVPTAVYLLDEPYEVDRSVEWARYYDWVFTVDRSTVKVHAENSNSIHMPCGYDDAIFRPDGPSAKSDVLMLGSPFPARENIMGKTIRKFGNRFTWVGPGWSELCTAGTHHNHLVTPEDCAKLYRGAGITLNIHRDSTWSHFGDLNKEKLTATHLNPRFWESAACGGFPLSSYRSDQDIYAKKGASFKTEDELVTKLEYYLNNAKARKQQAKILIKAVRKHSYLERAKQVLDLVIKI